MSRISLTVLIDDVPLYEDLIAAHGLSMYIEIESEKKKIKILFDSGPNPKILRYNAEKLGIDLESLDLYFTSIWLSHHILGFKPGIIPTVIPPLPCSKEVMLPLSKAIYRSTIPKLLKDWGIEAIMLNQKSLWKEQGLAIKYKNDSWILFLGCCIYGFEYSAKDAIESLKGDVYAIIGGLGLSTRDVFGFNSLDYIVKKKNVKLIIPLHSVSIEARELILKKYKSTLISSDMTGVGLEVNIG